MTQIPISRTGEVWDVVNFVAIHTEEALTRLSVGDSLALRNILTLIYFGTRIPIQLIPNACHIAESHHLVSHIVIK